MVSYRTVKFLFCCCNASNAVIGGSVIITVKLVPTATNVLPLVSQLTMATVGSQCYPLVLMPPLVTKMSFTVNRYHWYNF